MRPASIADLFRNGLRARQTIGTDASDDTARMYGQLMCIVGDEWPCCRDALLAWLDPANFSSDGTALHGLVELRTRLG